jgi:hypothetical protein
MPPFAGFIGPSYQGRAFQADAEDSINWFPEAIESPGGRTKTSYALLSKPGLRTFATVGASVLNSYGPGAPIDAARWAATAADEDVTDGDYWRGYGPIAFAGALWAFPLTQQPWAGTVPPGFVADSSLLIYKSADGGATWVKQDAAHAPTITKLGQPDSHVASTYGSYSWDGVSSIVTIAYLGDAQPAGVFHFNSVVTLVDFDMATGLFGAPYAAHDFWFVPAGFSAASPRQYSYIRNHNIFKLSGGILRLLFEFQWGDNNAGNLGCSQVYYSDWNGASWSALTLFPGQTVTANTRFALYSAVEDGDTIHVVCGGRRASGGPDPHLRLTASALSYYQLAKNGTFTGPVAVTFPAAAANWWCGMGVVSGANLLFPAYYLNAAGTTLFVGALSAPRAAPAFTFTQVDSGVWMAGGGGAGFDFGFLTDFKIVHLAAADVMVGVFHHADSGATNLFKAYTSTDSGASWSAPAAILNLDATPVDPANRQPDWDYLSYNNIYNSLSLGVLADGSLGLMYDSTSIFYAPASAVPALGGAIRAECALNGRGWFIAVSGANNVFYELHADGSVTNHGTLPGDRRPQIIPGLTQLLILAGGLGYVFDLKSNTLTRILDPDFPIGAVKGGFLDGFFIVLEPNSQVFAISALNDGTSWDPLDFGDVEGEPGNITTFVVDHRQIWFLGNNHGEIYVDSGNALFPFSRLEGAYMEQGAGSSIDGAFRCDNTIFWLGGNADGQGICWRANGYTPQRISTHAIEKLVASFGGDLSRVSGYPYQEEGHTFARWDFPDANDGRGASLLYDCAGGAWHRRAFWNARLAQYMGDLARTHMFVFGKHLVGDWRSGTIYEQSMDFFSDAGAAIRRLRAAPDLANGGKWTFYPEFRLLMDVGVGVDGAGFAAPDSIPEGGAPCGSGVDPQIILQWSNDGGKTWSSERPTSAGKIGDYKRLVRWRQTGRSNNRCFRAIYSEPTDASLVAADIDIEAGG